MTRRGFVDRIIDVLRRRPNNVALQIMDNIEPEPSIATVTKGAEIMRAFTFPKPGDLAQLVCIPTTSGTGAEVTPFAVISDSETGRKYPLADYALTPTVAIVDPVLTANMPARLAADSGFDALTHATEAFVSVYANDFTDGMALQAIKLIFANITESVTVRGAAADARGPEGPDDCGVLRDDVPGGSRQAHDHGGGQGSPGRCPGCQEAGLTSAGAPA
jgi:acetaldehyde dehydrogenase/alcohol dehydrogenase